MLIDTHIHVGQFNNLYISPLEIHNLMGELGVDYYAVASTTQCEENYVKVLSELRELTKLDGGKVMPIMWITPDSLLGNIAWYLESEIKWRMIKIHPFLNKTEWMPGGNLLDEVLEISRFLKLPLLIHTGEDNCCSAKLYESVTTKNPEITFILAHGRPLHSAIEMAKHYQNVYVDTAFMPVENIREFVKHGLSDKLLWGSDLCIPRFFKPEIDLTAYYNDRISEVMSFCTMEQFDQITFKNAQAVFAL